MTDHRVDMIINEKYIVQIKERKILKFFVRLTTEFMEIFSFLWFAGCLGANIFHIYNLIYEYSKYEVSTDVQYVHPEVIEVPTTVFCFYLYKTLRLLEITKEEQLQLLRREPDEYSNETTWFPHDFNNQTLKARHQLYEKVRNVRKWKTESWLTWGTRASINNSV